MKVKGLRRWIIASSAWRSISRIHRVYPRTLDPLAPVPIYT